jgi:cellulose synthase/poly-beta-1,6-N-acetylglucosamine synthase-like glycosyltransferase
VGAAKSDLLLVTDADCRPPRDWLANLSAQLREDVAGIACGITVVTGSSLVARVQALDWLLLSSVAAGFSEMGVPVTAMGNNMAFRRAAYENVGGYPALPFSVTEDYVLFNAIGRSKKWHARLILHPAVLNTTLPVMSWREMFSQRKRWARGGLRAGPGMYSVYMLIFLTHVSLLILLFANPPAALLLIASKAAIDAFVVRSAARHLGFRPSFAAFPAFEAYLFTYIASMPFVLALSPKIRWKGRRH